MAMEEDDCEAVVEGLSDKSAISKSPSLAELPRKQRRKALKKEKRKQKRREAAEKARQEEKAWLDDPEEQRRIQVEEEREKERMEQERREFEEKERAFLEALARKKAQEQDEEDRRLAEEEAKRLKEKEAECDENEDDEWEYVEEGPPEIIWQGNEIIVKKNKVKVKKKDAEQKIVEEDQDRPTSNPLLPQSEAYAAYRSTPMPSAQQLLQNVAQQVPNFGTEQDKAHCPFHLKTGACRFGSRCSRVHFYPNRSCTLLIKNMYSGPGLAWEQDEGLEYTDEEVERSYEEFYEDVHTEFLKFGEIVNFKVCRNGLHHLRGNVYVHYASVDDAALAFHGVNGRYYAGKQMSCEFVSVTKWKVAICGEYMKSRLKTCTRGTACNFIHCFHNPGGDYEWANWDKPPPKYWVKKMTALFGYSHSYEKSYERESPRRHENHSSERLPTSEQRYFSRRSQSTERKSLNKSPRDHNRKDESQRSQYRKMCRSDTRPDTSEREYEEEQYSTSRGHEKKRRRQHDSESDKDRYPDDGDGYHDRKRKKTSRHLESPNGRETSWSGTVDGEEHRKYSERRSRKEEIHYSTAEGSYESESDKDRYHDDGDGYHDRRRRTTSRHLETPNGRETSCSGTVDGEEHHKYSKRRSRKEEIDYSTAEGSYDTDTSREHSYENRSLSSNDHLHRKRRIYDSDSTGYSTDESTHSIQSRRRKSKTRKIEVSGRSIDQQDSEKSRSDLSRSKSSRKKKITKWDDNIETRSPEQPESVDETRKQRRKSHGKSRSHDRSNERWEDDIETRSPEQPEKQRRKSHGKSRSHDRSDERWEDNIETRSPEQPESVDETRKQKRKTHGKSRSHDRWEESRSRSRLFYQPNEQD